MFHSLRMIVVVSPLLSGPGSTIAADPIIAPPPRPSVESKVVLIEAINDLAAVAAAIAWIKEHPGIIVRHLTVTPRQGRASVARIEYTEQ